MASGKSTVGRLVARALGVPFLDTDRLIEERARKSVAEIFSGPGEDFFRRLEAEVVGELLPLGRVVVALGGGTLGNAALRRDLLQDATLVVLTVSAETARSRAASGPVRPLLRGDIAGLLAARAPEYAGAHVTIDTNRRTPGEVAEELLTQVFDGAPPEGAPQGCLRIEGRTRAGNFPVFVGTGLLEDLPTLVPEGKGAFVVGDELTAPLFAPRLASKKGIHLLPRGEGAKTLEQVRSLYEDFAAFGVDRGREAVVALGGGTVGDCAGFAAATWMRGVPILQCPTTLLSMVDSSMGGKTGVNLPQGKNLVGAFHHPVAVVADVECLQTLPAAEWRQGLAEAVKYGVGEDQSFLAHLAEDHESIGEGNPEALIRLVERCARMKLAVVAEDEGETLGARARLNLGHTVGHALESASNFRWKHGDAVAAGLAVATTLGVHLGSCSSRFAAFVENVLALFGLPRRPDLSWSTILPFVARDKKFQGGRCRFVLPVEGGRCELRELSLHDLQRAYEETAKKKEDTPWAHRVFS